MEGPCVIEEATTTILLLPAQSATMDDFGNYLVELDTATVLGRLQSEPALA